MLDSAVSELPDKRRSLFPQQVFDDACYLRKRIRAYSAKGIPHAIWASDLRKRLCAACAQGYPMLHVICVRMCALIAQRVFRMQFGRAICASACVLPAHKGIRCCMLSGQGCARLLHKGYSACYPRRVCVLFAKKAFHAACNLRSRYSRLRATCAAGYRPPAILRLAPMKNL